jgi:hypothetical protein
LGAALCARFIALGWRVRTRVPQSVRLPAEGRRELSERLRIVFTGNGIQSDGQVARGIGVSG